MTKPYFNSALVGDSKMLACLTDSGELIRLFWPNIDYPQHIDRFRCGIFVPGIGHSTSWMNDPGWFHTQSYIEDTNILQTVCINHELQLTITQTDFVLPDHDTLCRGFEIANTGQNMMNVGFIVYTSGVSTSSDMLSTLFDFQTDSLIHYRHNYYTAVCSNTEVHQFQLGNNAYDSASYSELRGIDSIGMMPDAAVSWRLGVLAPGAGTRINLYFCAAHTLNRVKALTEQVRSEDYRNQLESTEKYWKSYLKRAREYKTGDPVLDCLYRRSLLVFKLMADENGGGLLAAPELDENFTKSGRYGYCWARDAAFITGALDKAGLCEIVDRFYEWAVRAQDSTGAWHQRYHVDGNLAPSWGLQIDETGTVIWGMLQHYEATKDRNFLKNVWESVRKAMKFMLDFTDKETGLPRPSYDLWEERNGEHAYSSAAVYAGVMAAVRMGELLETPAELLAEWRSYGEKLHHSILQNFWKEDWGRFVRSIRVKLNPWGEEYSEKTIAMEANPKGYIRNMTLLDETMDASILGLSVPFGVLDPEDERMRKSTELVERVLTSYKSGGVMRYENDNYIGGNPWIIITLLVALYYIRVKDYNKAVGYLEWAAKGRTPLDFLPEQIGREDGRPAWVIPLTWSHAMYVLVLAELYEAGVFSNGPEKH